MRKLLLSLLLILSFLIPVVYSQDIIVVRKYPAAGGGGVPTFDALSVDGASGTQVLTFSHTIGAISNGVLVVFIGHRRDGTTTVTTATWNTTEGLTAVGTPVVQGDTVIECWRRIAPTTGTHDVVVNITGGNATIVGIAVSVANVNQTTPLGTPATGTGITSPITATVSGVVATGLILDAFFTEDPAANIVVGANQTQRLLDNGAGSMDHGSSTQSGADGGVMSWTSATDSGNWQIIAVECKPL